MITSKEEQLLIDLYWTVRVLSVLDLEHSGLNVVFKDAYTALNNMETYFTYESASYFEHPVYAKMYLCKYVNPLLSCIKIVKDLNLDILRTKSITNFIRLYGQNLPKITTFSELCKKHGLEPPESFDYQCSRKWFTYPGNLKKVGKNLLLYDWMLQNGVEIKEIF